MGAGARQCSIGATNRMGKPGLESKTGASVNRSTNTAF
jgi:hypothetical protein